MAVSRSFWVQWRSMSVGRTCYNVASYFWLAFSFSLTKEINSPRTVREWEGAGQTRIRHWAPNKTTTKGLKRKKQIHIPMFPSAERRLAICLQFAPLGGRLVCQTACVFILI